MLIELWEFFVPLRAYNGTRFFSYIITYVKNTFKSSLFIQCMIPIRQMYGCQCGSIFHIHLSNNRNHCPVCGRGLNYTQKLEWTTLW